MHYTACQSFERVLNDAGILFGYSVVPQQLPKTFSINAIEGSQRLS